MRKKAVILALVLGCITILSGCANYIKETEDALDPLGYAVAGYYGKTREELIELLPELEEGDGPNMEMVRESAISKTVKCKQVFCFYENRVVEIQYIYLFKEGEEGEEKFIEQCKRFADIDENAYPGNMGRMMMVSEISEGFWDNMLVKGKYVPRIVQYMTFCDEENTRNVNEEAVPGGWKKQYMIGIDAVFVHKEIDLETNVIRESGATLPDGSEARIILTIATWD